MEKIAFFSTKPYDQDFFSRQLANHPELSLDFLEPSLTLRTLGLAEGCSAICVFVNDTVDEPVLEGLAKLGVKLIALRCAGYNNVNVAKAHELGMKVVRVPEYSPYAVAEHALALLLAVNRRIHRAFNRVREGNFSLNGLMGFDLHGKTVGIVGTGRIGRIFAQIMKGLGCKLLAYDPYQNLEAAQEIGFTYVPLSELYANSHVISLHLPLNPDTYHLIDEQSIAQMKDQVVLINTSRGKLIDTAALIEGLKSEKIKAAGLDVYEEEDAYFFADHSDEVMQDDLLARLMGFNNVIITAHQAFFTAEALINITDTTLGNISAFFAGAELKNAVLSS